MARNLGVWNRVREVDLAVVQSFGAFSPGGQFLASADTNTVEVRHTPTGTITATMEMAAVTSLAVSPDGSLLVAADDDGNINAWTMPPARPLWQAHLTLPPPAYAQVVFDVQFAGTKLAVVSKPAGINNTVVELWPITAQDKQRPAPLWQNVLLNSDYQAFSPSPAGDRVLLATHDGYWVLLETGDRLFIDEYYGSGEHAVVAFSTDGTRAAAVEEEGAWTYTVAAHAIEEIQGMEGLQEPSDIVWSPEGDLLLITSDDGLGLCGSEDDKFSWLGLIEESSGFEAACFVTSDTIAAKRGDILYLFTRES